MEETTEVMQEATETMDAGPEVNYQALGEVAFGVLMGGLAVKYVPKLVNWVKGKIPKKQPKKVVVIHEDEAGNVVGTTEE